VVIQIPDDRSLAPHGLMHEGLVSTRIGLAGKPIMAEELLVARDIELAAYTNSALHFTGITSPKSLDHIRQAKSRGVKITCSVTPYHLFFDDSFLWNYETQYKVYPPLRTTNEIDSLKKAVFDGTIDCFSSHHMPHERDSKDVEFEYAANGMIGLESMFSALNKVLPGLPNNRWAELLGLNARKIFGLPIPLIEEGAEASLTLYTHEGSFLFGKSHIRSNSANTAFLGQELKGQPIAIFNNNKNQIN
jgi:dihydroorotase